MKRKIITLIFLAATITLLFASCGHKHNYKVSEVVEPTCTKDGYTVYLCDCGDTYNEVAERLQHDFEESKVEPTCQNDGYTLKKCKNCGEEEKSNFVKATGKHIYKTVVTKKPTCTSEGIQREECEICGTYSSKIEKMAKLPHEYKEHTVEATCEEDGYTEYICENCGEEKQGGKILLPKLEHDYQKGDTHEPTCNDEGYTEYICSRCKGTKRDDIKDSLGHDYAATVIDPTCTEKGYTKHVCSRCNDEYKDEQKNELGHDIDKENDTPTEILNPTCITDGHKIYACKRDDCTYTEKVVVGKTGIHIFDKEIKLYHAECEEGEYMLCGCSSDENCTETHKQYNEEHGPTGHNIVFDDEHFTEKLDSTCAVRGYNRYRCTNVGNDGERCTHTEDDMLDIVPHTHGDTIRTVAPTCINKGYTVYECTVCNNEFSDDFVDATGIHGGWEKVETIDPTCVADGYTVYKCTFDDDCKETKQDDVVHRIRHDFVKVDGGIKCSSCEHTYAEILYGNHITIKKDIDLGDGVTGTVTVVKDPTKDFEISGGVYEITSDSDLRKGIITVKPNGDEAVFKIEIKVGDDWISVGDELTGDIQIDLFEYTDIDVTAVRITATAAAVLGIYQY